MTNTQLQQAFVRGFIKRAEQLGLEKEAFVLPLAANLIRTLGAPILSAELSTRGLGALAKRTGRIGAVAKKTHDFINKSPGANIAWQMGSGMALDPVLSKPMNAVADLIHKEPTPPTEQQYAG